MRASDILEKVKERNAIETEKLQKKAAAAMHREKMQLAFNLCSEICPFETSECIITGLKQCSVCKNVIKSQCSKASCIIDGKKPVMIVGPSARPSATSKQLPVHGAKLRARWRKTVGRVIARNDSNLSTKKYLHFADGR